MHPPYWHVLSTLAPLLGLAATAHGRLVLDAASQARLQLLQAPALPAQRQCDPSTSSWDYSTCYRASEMLNRRGLAWRKGAHRCHSPAACGGNVPSDPPSTWLATPPAASTPPPPRVQSAAGPSDAGLMPCLPGRWAGDEPQQANCTTAPNPFLPKDGPQLVQTSGGTGVSGGPTIGYRTGEWLAAAVAAR